MTEDLRSRIAAALDKALPVSAGDLGFYQRLGETPLVDIEAYDLNLELLADAVIRELGLREQTGNNAAHPQVIPCAEYLRTHHRYVTDWKADTSI